MGKALIALIALILLALSTLLQIVYDWYQSYAYGVPHADRTRILVVVAGVLALLALVLTIVSKGGRV